MYDSTPAPMAHLIKDAELVFDITAATSWFAHHDAALQLAELVNTRQLCAPTITWRLRLVVHELLRNAIEHGNLEVHSQNKHTSLEALSCYYTDVDTALNTPTLAERNITLSIWFKDKTFIGLVQDSGSGFTFDQDHGLGYELIKRFTSSITHINQGSGAVFTLEDNHVQL